VLILLISAVFFICRLNDAYTTLNKLFAVFTHRVSEKNKPL